MKKLYFALLLVLLVGAQNAALAVSHIWDGTIDTLWFSTAPAATEYNISTAEQLAGLAALVNAGRQNFSGRTIRLTQDIVLNNTGNWQNWGATPPATLKEWTPIGLNATRSFQGTFNGQNFRVLGVFINQPTMDNMGLFGFVDGGTFQNVGVEASFVSGKFGVGGLAGYMGSGSTITNSYNTGTVSGIFRVGGLAGYKDRGSTITNSYNTGTVSGGDGVGGLVGEMGETGSITNSFNTGAVSGQVVVGGLVGFFWGKTITNSNNNGTVSGILSVGGLAGCTENSTISNSYNTGTVNAEDREVGGLVGCMRSGSTITNSYNTGTVSAEGREVGGLVGDLRRGSTITNSYNTGTVNGNDAVGGLVGAMGDFWSPGGSITNSFNTGAVSGTTQVGGLVGENWGSITNSYFLAEAATSAIGDGTGANLSRELGQFTSGEVAHLLQGTQPVFIWGHTVLGATELPLLRHFAPTARQVRRVDFTSTEPVHTSTRFFLNGDSIVFPALVRAGHRPEWRDTSNNVFTPTSQVTADLTLTAYWSNQATITFNSAGGSAVTAITQVIGTAVTAPAPPTRIGHTFAGWNPEFPATMPAENLTLTAQWTVNQYTITFISAGGSAVAPITQDFGSAITAPANPTRVGHTFAGWNPAVPETMPAENLTLTAQWTVNQYTITFNSAGGSEVAPITQDFGSVVTAPANPTRIGHTFAGWNPEVPATMPAGGLTLTAQWTVNQYTITFNSAGGSAVDPITQDFGTVVTAPANPTRIGHTFAGWLPAVPETMPAENLTLTAQWTVNQYTITFNSAGGSAVAPITQDFGSVVTAPANPTRTGHIFTGWHPTIPATMPAGGTILTAQWANTSWFTGPAPGAVFDISTAEELAGLAFLVNNGTHNFSGMTVRLLNNIKLNDTTNWRNWSTSPPANRWTPIGTIITGTPNIERPFRGTFDGQGHRVLGVYINQPTLNRQGLFEVVVGSTIQNVGVEASFIRGQNYVGGLVGRNEGTVTNSNNSGAVIGNFSVGGLVGANVSGSSITNSNNSGAVSGPDVVGGLVGWNAGTVTSSHNTGAVTGREWDVGGLVGWNVLGSSITQSYNAGAVSGARRVGGLAGWNMYGTVTSSYNTGTASGNDWVGGLVGLNDGSVTNSYNTGTASGNTWVGGLAGWNVRGSSITHSYNSGTVIGTDGIGGLVGVNDGQVTSSSNNGTVTGTFSHIGGLAGGNNGTVTNSYNIGTVSGSFAVGGLAGALGGIWAPSGSITNSFNTGAVNGRYQVGGLVGENWGSITNSYFLAEVATSAIGDGTGADLSRVLGQFTSGEVAHLLQGAQTDFIWGHTVLGATQLPRLRHFVPTALQVRRVDFASTEPAHTSTRFFLNGNNLVFPVIDRPGFRAVWRDAQNNEFTTASPVTADLALTAHWVHDVTSIEPGIREEGFGVALFPNPVRHNLAVRISGADEYVGRTAELAVYDLKGRKFLSETIQIHGAHIERTFDVSLLPPGAAILVLDIEGVGIKRKVFLKSER